MEKNDFYIAESVSEGHADKICDQISDSILDAFLSKDKNARVACEVFATKRKIIIGGEITSSVKVNYKKIARKVLEEIGYSKKFSYDPKKIKIEVLVNQQSKEISNLVDNREDHELGAGDQGIVVGYATNQTKNYMPLHFVVATEIVKKASVLRKKELNFLGPDAKSQVLIDFSNKKIPIVKKVLFSTQHTNEISLEKLREIITKKIIIPVLKELKLNIDCIIDVNPLGSFVLGGPSADTGLTGRKLMVDNYGSSVSHGGGAFSGKDPTKIDRSAAYMARYIAKNLVANNIADEITVFLSYTIGDPKPFGVNVWLVNSSKGFNRKKVIEIINENFDLTPKGIIEKLDLINSKYKETSTYGHFGRNDFEFTWEKVDFKLNSKKK